MLTWNNIYYTYQYLSVYINRKSELNEDLIQYIFTYYIDIWDLDIPNYQ